jgi:hypothetical protein
MSDRSTHRDRQPHSQSTIATTEVRLEHADDGDLLPDDVKDDTRMTTTMTPALSMDIDSSEAEADAFPTERDS